MGDKANNKAMPKDEKVFFEKSYKIVVVGDIGVGKSALIYKYTRGIFTDKYKVTIGVDFATKQIYQEGVKTEDGEVKNMKYNMQLWDIAGQERFGNMTRIYVKEASAAIIVCDITRPQTYHSSVKWKKNIEEILDRKIPTALIINKNDLKYTVDRHSSYPPDIAEFVKSNGFNFYEEISAKNDTDKIENIFDQLLELMKEETIKKENKEGETIPLVLMPMSSPPPHRRCCY